MIKSVLRKARAYYNINPTFSDCPSCRTSGTLMRSHTRNVREKLLSKITFRKFYR